jgi:hypothetical protein
MTARPMIPRLLLEALRPNITNASLSLGCQSIVALPQGGTSRAPWIAVLDADDYFLPGRMSYLLSHADSFDWQIAFFR